MNKSMVFTGVFLLASASQAACLMDDPEIGDIGPTSERGCTDLQNRFPESGIVVVGRAIHSATCVSLLAAVDGKPVSVEYELADWQWRARP